MRISLGAGSVHARTNDARLPRLLAVVLLVAVALVVAAPAGRARAATSTTSGSGFVALVPTTDGQGYWLARADGRVLAYGDATSYGDPSASHPNKPVVGMAATPDGRGYWLVASDGGVFAYGDASFFGSTGSLVLNRPIVGMATTADGRGYWLVASDGGVFAYGDAPFRGSAGSLVLNKPVVGMTADATGGGYWLVASDGGIFAFGDAGFHGSAGGEHLAAPITSVAATADGAGYWLGATDGGVFTYGDAGFFGSGTAPRLALYGDSLGMQAAQDFGSIAASNGAPTLLRAVSGWAPCDELSEMQSDVTSWQPTVAVLEFAGNNTTSCMSGYAVGTAAYYAKYQSDITAAVSVLRAGGASVILVGVPLDSAASLTANIDTLNAMYASIAAQSPGVSYVDAGQAVMANGQFTWTLPCLPTEQCTGTNGTNTVRQPDGVHFCPDGVVTEVGPYAECAVYSSGAWRFALAMVGPALGQ